MIDVTRRLLGILKGASKKITGITRVEVEGNSMLPTYRHGQRVWVKLYEETISAEKVLRLRGQVILVEREEYPGIFLLKRLEKVHGDLIWIEGDNKDPAIAELQHDSRKFGWLDKVQISGLILTTARRSKKLS